MNKSAFNSVLLSEVEKQELLAANVAFEARLSQLPKVGAVGYLGPESMT